MILFCTKLITTLLRTIDKRVLMLLFLSLIFFDQISFSQTPFTPGNIVVVRVGNGSTPLSGTTQAVFLDEYSPAGGTPIQTVAMPTAPNGANKRLTFQATTTPIGVLSLSDNKQFISLVGYDVATGTSNITANGAATQRVVAIIDYNGTVNTSTGLTDAGSNAAYSAVTSDGTKVWAAFTTGGLRYTTLGSNTSTQIIPPSPLIRVVSVFGGDLYYSTQSPSIEKLSGLPTTGPQTNTTIISNNTGQSSYFFADLNPAIPGYDVLYLAGEVSALQKFSFDGTSWVLNGQIGVGSPTVGVGDSYANIAAVISGTTVTLYATRKVRTGSSFDGSELVTLSDNTGYTLASNSFTGTPTVLATAAPNTAFRGVAMAPVPPSVNVSSKIFLQGAYNAGLGRHKDVTSAWATVLNTNATTQPFNTAPFNYTGTESVSNTFFQSTAGTTDVLDWVLLELRDATTPATVIARRAAFIREDGMIVDLDGTSSVRFTNVTDGNYHVVIRHRNHLPIRTTATLSLGGTATLYDFTTAQNKAYQNGSVTTNEAMKDLGGSVFGMYVGDLNGNGNIRFTGLANDAGVMLSALGSNQAAVLTNVYHICDLNMDGTVRYTGLNNDAGLILAALNTNQSAIVTQHQ